MFSFFPNLQVLYFLDGFLYPPASGRASRSSGLVLVNLLCCLASCWMPFGNWHLVLDNLPLPLPPPRGSRSHYSREGRSDSDPLKGILWPKFGAKCLLKWPSCLFNWSSCSKIPYLGANMTPRSPNLKPRCLSVLQLWECGANLDPRTHQNYWKNYVSLTDLGIFTIFAFKSSLTLNLEPRRPR